jgi:FkbM family methyltransferase
MFFPHFKNLWKQFVFNLSASNNVIYNIYYQYFYKPRKNTVAEIIDLFSKQNESVTFLQVGANDGFFHDPLHKFIKKYKWRGVLLEPQRDVYKNYLSRLYKNSPSITAINAALDYQDGIKPIYKISFSKSRWATGLTSFNKSALMEAIDSGHVERCAKRYQEQLPENKTDYIGEENITCISPKTLLQQYNLKKIDWLQIDAEGYDYEIIKMLNNENSWPTVVVFEHSHLSKQDYSECIQHLSKNNYATTSIKENTVAMKNPSHHFQPFFNSKDKS